MYFVIIKSVYVLFLDYRNKKQSQSPHKETLLNMLRLLSDSPSELPALRRTHCSWRKAGLFVLATRMLSGSAS